MPIGKEKKGSAREKRKRQTRRKRKDSPSEINQIDLIDEFTDKEMKKRMRKVLQRSPRNN